MKLNPELAGRSYPATEPYLVAREKLREFAKATYATNPIHFDLAAAQSAGYSDLVATTTFPVVIQERSLTALIADPDAGIDFARVVHGEQRFRYARPIVAGDLLSSVLTVQSVRSVGGHTMVTAESVISDQHGLPVVSAISSLVIRATG